MTLAIEGYRKFLHFLLIIIPIVFVMIGRWPTVMILAPIAILVVGLDYMRRNNPGIQNIFVKIFGYVLRPHELEGNKLCGASWVALGAVINFALFPKIIAVTGFLILVISDALASLVGKAVPSEKFYEKSFSGSAAFFISALVILISCGVAYHAPFSFYFFGVFMVFCVTIIEARPSFTGIDDNFTIPIVFGVMMSFFDILWNYSY